MRLKWGDPFVFDSGGKEALFLHEQGIPFEVVPGIPVTVGGPAYAGIPVTYPGAGDVLALVRGNESESGAARPVDWGRLAGIGGTLVCYARRAADHGGDPGADGARPPEGGDRRAHLRRDPALAADRRGHARHDCRERRRERTGAAGRRRGRGVARAPALVRRPAALGTPHRRHAIARAGRRARRHAGGARRGGDSGPRHPDRARPRTPPRSTRRARRPGRTDWIVFTSANAVDYFMRRLLATGDVRDLHGVQLCAVGPSTGVAPAALRPPRRSDAGGIPRGRGAGGAEGVRRAEGPRGSCCRAPTSRASCSARSCARPAPT